MERTDKKQYRAIFVFVGKKRHTKGEGDILIKRADSLDDLKKRYTVMPTFSPRRYKRDAASNAQYFVSKHVCIQCNGSKPKLTPAPEIAAHRGICDECMGESVMSGGER